MNSYLTYILPKVKIAAFLTVLVGLLTYGIIGHRTEAASTDCLRKSTADASITVSGNVATAHFTIPKNCAPKVVTLVSYKAPNTPDARPYVDQVLFDSTTKTYQRAGSHIIRVNIPTCSRYQIDLARGNPIQEFSHGHTYTQEDRFLAAKIAGKPCPAPAPAPVTPSSPAPSAPAPAPAGPAPVITNNNTNTNTNTVTNNPPAVTTTSTTKTEAAPVEGKNEVGSLPNTGPGSIVAIFGTVTAVSSLAYQLVVRRFGL